MNPSRIVFSFLGILLLTLIILWVSLLRGPWLGTVSVHALDVGQGDAFLVVDGNTQVLIDGGPRGDVLLKELTNLLPLHDRTIELVILTHPQADHISGLLELVRRYRVLTVLAPDVTYDSALFREWQELLREHGVVQVPARAGQVVYIGRNSAFQVFYPFRSFGGTMLGSKEINDISVVGKLVVGDATMLFTGDAELGVEYAMLRTRMNLESDILKIGHHGSRTSSSSVFLDAVRPQAALLSLGRLNRFGHPHKEVLDRLMARDIRFYRTDEEGAIHLMSDGIRWCEEKTHTCFP